MPARGGRIAHMAAWRFSIRELFLLTTAAAAILALSLVLIDRRLPVRESALARDFGAWNQFSAALETVSPNSAITGTRKTAGRHGRALSCEYTYSMDLAPALHGQLMGELANEFTEAPQCPIELHGNGQYTV